MKIMHYEFIFEYIEKLIGTTIPQEEKENIMRVFKPRKLKEKEMLVREGDIPNCITFNISGLLRCYYIDNNGNDITKYFCFEGSIISYLGLVLRKESQYYIEALEECVLLCADYDSFEELISNNCLWLKIIKAQLEQALIYKEERESEFLLETATERYVHLIDDFPDIEKRIKLGYIASYLGISQVKLSRIRKKLGRI